MGMFDWLIKPTSTPVSSTQSTTTTLGKGAQDLYDASGSLFSNLSKPITPYQGPTVAGFDPSQVAGQNKVLGAAGGGAQTLADQGQAAQSGLLAGFDPNNPQLQAMLEGIREQTTRNLNENILPGIRGGETMAGGPFSGNNTHGALATGKAVGDTENNLIAQLTKAMFGARDADLNRQQAAVQGNAQQIANTAAPGVMESAVGDVRQAQQQKEYDAQVALDSLTKTMPLQQAMLVLQALGMMPGATTTSTGTGTVPGPSLLNTIVGGASAGLGAAGLLGWKPFGGK